MRSRNVLFHKKKFHSFEISDKETVLEQDDVKGGFDEDGQFTVIPGDPTITPVTANHEEDVPAVGATFEENFCDRLRISVQLGRGNHQMNVML